MKTLTSVIAATLLVATPALAAKPLKVKMDFVSADGVGKPAGTVTIKETKDGVMLQTDLKGLTPGEHGFHMHDKASCDAADKDGKKTAAQAAGGHFDPDATKAHKGPDGGGHKGDLPKITASDKGVSKEKLDVKGLKLADFAGHSLMIHEGGDNYSDMPKPLGGGGARIACGVIP
ncbi:MAG TPA: superoxide dismutase [Cu-Zn] SodC [Polyangia bacterium]|jgi:Cu-Zn family superoxide dismutase|nr:superoxide dismutase [Cu-Zn] SodC [Polyangia bacterium]